MPLLVAVRSCGPGDRLSLAEGSRRYFRSGLLDHTRAYRYVTVGAGCSGLSLVAQGALRVSLPKWALTIARAYGETARVRVARNRPDNAADDLGHC